MRKDVLTMPPEVGLLSNVLEHNRFSLAQYGQLVYESIKSEKVHNWLATLLASNFWRILGKPKEAIDCLRKSIYSAPVNYKHLGLLSLANVFHRTHNSQVKILIFDPFPKRFGLAKTHLVLWKDKALVSYKTV